MIHVGECLAKHMDIYVESRKATLPEGFFYNAIHGSETHKARLLHYFPTNETEVDGWCGEHVDHSLVHHHIFDNYD